MSRSLPLRPLLPALAAGFFACGGSGGDKIIGPPHQDPPSQVVLVTAPSGGVTGQPLNPAPTVQIENDSNRAMPVSGILVTASVFSGGGSLTGTAAVATNASGVATFSNLAITGSAGGYVLQFAAPTLTAAHTSNLTMTAPASCGSTGTAPTLTSLTRNVGSGAGGDTLQILGSGFQSIAAGCVLFGTTPATSVVFLGSTKILVTTPAHGTATVNVRVVQNSDTATMTGAFDYEPAPATIYANATFEAGVLAPFSKDLSTAGVVVVDSTLAHLGTHSAHCSIPTGVSGIAQLFTTYGNPAFTSPTGVYHRWYLLLPKHTKDNVVGSTLQVKLHISRVGGTQPPPGWLMFGVGTAFGSSPAGEVVIVQDDGTFTIGHTGFVIPDSQWVEMETWYHRSGGLGYAKLWINGRFAFADSAALFGSDTPTDDYAFQVCIPFAQISGPIDEWVDDVEAADGFISPNH